MILYLIHFHEPYKHARHYLGITSNASARIKKHASGNGNPLMRAVCKEGIHWGIVRVWPDATRSMEKQLKNQKNAKRLCPVCNPDGWKRRGNV